MTRKHLLWWIIAYLQNNHPSVLTDMLENISGDGEDKKWVASAFLEAVKKQNEQT